MADESKPRKSAEDEIRDRMGRATVPPALQDPKLRPELGLPESEHEPGWYIVELNLQHEHGLKQATEDFQKLYKEIVVESKTPPKLISKSYVRCLMSVDQWRRMVEKDESRRWHERAIYKIWPDFPIKALIDRSIVTIKADAAFRSFAAGGQGIVWAVIDSGIDADHVHFGGPRTNANAERHTLYAPTVAQLHRDFTVEFELDEVMRPNEKEEEARQERNQALRMQNVSSALADDYGHGTHVAGIIAGGLPEEPQKRLKSDTDFFVYEQVFSANPNSGKGTKRLQPRPWDSTVLRGVAPLCKLVSLKVLDGEGRGSASNIIRALEYIHEELNGDPKLLRVHGVNLSVGYEFDAELFACGQSPLCVAVDRLVKSGVSVVVAAGNTGYGKLTAEQRPTRVGLSNTINDPGNAALAITVGATHRDSPHTFGVSYFSSKGPTGDGRLKPDLVAPGERITSCAAAQHLRRIDPRIGDNGADAHRAYVDDSGTSMAAPHVSGAVAAFLSIRREFIQQPERLKEIFLSSATSLGRERYFEGHGLVDLMRAIQSV